MDVWSKILSVIEKDLKKQGMEKQYSTLFSSSKQISYENDILTVEFKSIFTIGFIKDNYLDMIETIMKKLNISATLNMIPETHSGIMHNNQVSNESVAVENTDEWEYLNNQYTFENFVEYTNNRMAVQIAKQIALKPGSKLNPLLIYGGVGLGKTHLMHAIGNQIKSEYPKTRIAYIMINKFVEDFINSIKNQTTDKFKKRFFSFDVILLDDIQFIVKTESVQNELFHIFNDFYHKKKQIVLASDRPLKDISGMTERLMSRFNSGAVVDIQKPNIEARIAIIKKKLEQENMQLDEESIFYIANNIKSNIRDLHSVVVNIYARVSVEKKQEIDISMVKEIVHQYVIPGTKKITIEDIKKSVCEYFDISEKQIVGKSRKKEIAIARQIAMYLSMELSGASLSNIGRFYGKHHSTVMHSIEKIKIEIKTNDEINKYIEEISSKLQY